ncbi:methyltransferase domain-containing protein [Streptomyces sp. 15-116A]|uniref:class I SAM-dependent methyltransferase n=1 Tax=Streptomyces sp. 15-116A TaxID=2259035 RepID=UPI0021B2B720|nr:class I SAM-dependent methyltransferase [Streptomyces sp. 15-116A]MCT7351139.1 methyltransferase domain-containing protein [Streptomyces sp. 15-116A]
MTDTSPPPASVATALARYTELPDPAPLLALNFGFAGARALGAAMDLGVFTALAEAPRTTARLAGDLSCDARILGELLEALEDFGLVSGADGAGWAPTELARAYLVKGAPGYLGDHFDEVLAQWDRWSTLTSLARSGDRGGDLGDPAGRGRHRGMFAGAFPLAVRTAADVVAVLELGSAGRVLDFTCGSGEWGIALAGTDPRARVTAHDDPALLAVARERATEFGVAERFRFVPADFADTPFAEGEFDTVVMAHAGRFAGRRTAARLIRECARVLRPGGTLLLADIVRTLPGQAPLGRPMLALSLLVNTENGGLPEADEYRALMAEAGIAVKECVTRGLVTALTGERQ